MTIRFGVFEVDPRSGELRKAGTRIRLQDQPFKVLLILLEHPGEVVRREDLRRRIWPQESFGDFDHAVNVAIGKLRTVLGDSADVPRYVETLHRRGYRFIAPVAPNDQKKASKPAQKWSIPAVAAIAILVILTSGGIAFPILSLPRVPRVSNVTQVTRSGRVDPWRRMVSDGSRIYFLERAGDHWNLMQTSVQGGEPQVVSSPFRNTLILDISPDHTEFLIASFAVRGGLMPLWIWPVQGGVPRRVGELMAYDAVWFPGGSQIIYGQKDGVYVGERDGTGSHRIVATEGYPTRFVRSPDGRRLRFNLTDESSGYGSAIWEVDVDGKHLHRLFTGWNDPPNEWDGIWAADGNYFFFDAFRDGLTSVWVAPEERSWLHLRQAGPVHLTAGPGDFSRPLAAGRRLFVIGATGKTELVHFDPESHQSTTLFADLHPWSARYSNDGQWAAVTITGGFLRKIKPDGTGEVALTAPPLETDSPVWSPDGKQVAFGGRTRSDHLWRLYVTSADGGTPREIVPSEGEQAHPSWSPDGKLLAFDQAEKAASGTSDRFSIHVLNVGTSQISVLPDSQGKVSPSWSPDGRFLAALTEDGHKLMLFDLRTQHWSQVTKGNLFAGTLSWSSDSKFLYFQDLLAPGEAVYRLRMKKRQIERVTSFEVFLDGGVPRCGFLGLTPDGALLVALLRNQADIYALTLDLP